jgi:hypothetical protein
MCPNGTKKGSLTRIVIGNVEMHLHGKQKMQDVVVACLFLGRGK